MVRGVVQVLRIMRTKSIVLHSGGCTARTQLGDMARQLKFQVFFGTTLGAGRECDYCAHIRGCSAVWLQ
jgi:hypothetical protein